MTPSDDLREVALAWWEYQRRAAGSRDERKALERGQPHEVIAARTFVDEAVALGGTAALDVILALLDATPSGADPTAVGVGPLEDLLHQDGDELVEAVESYARRRSAFAACLAAVWLERGHLSSDTEHRLEPWIGSLTTNK